MEDCAAAPLKPRERIISTARDLFRKHGIRGIGVDAIADVAGTNKMTLYRHFGSKDDLVVACLRDVARDAEGVSELARLVHLGDDVAATDELAVDEQLRDRRPAGDRRELLADPRIGKDVDRRERLVQRLKRGDRARREAAAGGLRGALHEEDHAVF